VGTLWTRHLPFGEEELRGLSSVRTWDVKKASQFKLAPSKPGYSYAAFSKAILWAVEVSTSKVFTLGMVSSSGRNSSCTSG
jgi:hypothetical protein